ncbi:MAG: sigma-70 family RNA polymerase sigma factor [Bacteroidia bacterium]|nr:sigma-70 family RNA polymerase sigma factor [Bacteroidia bacterium]
MELEIEQKLIEQSKADPQAFERLYIKYYEQILKFVYKRVESLDDTRDITSTVFIKALSNISKYKDMGFPFSSWLYRIAINEINMFYRKSKKARVISLNEYGLKNLANESSDVDPETLMTLKKSLLHLSPDELNLIELRFFENKAFAEMGVILDITEANAKIRTYRALDKLRSIYAKVA